MNNNINYVYIIGMIALSLLMVYFVLPRFFKNYQTEKGIKLLLCYGMMAYLSYDFYLKEKYLYIPFFIVGAIVFTYLIVIAKRKPD